MSFLKSFVVAVAGLCVCGATTGQAQTVLITEFMADNGGTLLDEDGDASDWLELHNRGASPVHLDGWYLTDDDTDRVKWRFPATMLEPGGFLVLFASSKSRAVSGSELHTNFKLSASGEYLALVCPDGITVEHEVYFPAQEEEVSYGYAYTAGGSRVVLDADAPCTAHIPTGPGDATGWTEIGFDDGGWQPGTTGVGYEAGSGYAHLIGTDVIDMRYTNQSVYTRTPFEIVTAGPIIDLDLKMKYDDAFVAYLNGVEVARSGGAPATPSWDSGSSQNHNDSAAVVFQDYELEDHVSDLVSGTNVLAVHVLNRGADSSDLLMLPRLDIGEVGELDLAQVGLLSTPTPGGANGTLDYLALVETPTAFPERGFYRAPIAVTLSNLTSGADLYYTLDGSEPTTNSLPYIGPIPIASTVNLRIRAFVENWKPSPVRTDTYIFVDDVVLQPRSESSVDGQVLVFGMDTGVVNKTYYDASNQVVTVQDALQAIPTISIATHYDNLFGPGQGIYVNAAQRWERPASMELIHPDGSKGFHINAGIRIRGGYSRHDNYEKHAFRLFFRREYGAGKLNHSLFEDEGVESFDKVDLRTAINYDWAHNSSSRNTFLRDIFCRDSSGAMGQDYTRSRYYHLYLNGLYWGLYMTEERPVADYAASYHGGDSDDYDAIKNTNWVDTHQYYAVEATDGTLDAYYRLYAAAMAGFTNNADYFSIQGLDANGQPDPWLEKLLDVENMIDYLLVIYYAGASDNCITKFLGGNQVLNNLYAVYNRVTPDGFKWIQHDCEHALDRSTDLNRTGPFNHSNFDLPEYFNAQTLHQKLSENPEYRMKFADRVYKHYTNGGAMVRTNCEARLDLRAAQIDRAIVANAARWGSTSLDRDTWVNAVESTRNFFSRSGDRCTEVIGYLEDDGLLPSILPPQLSRPSGVVEPGTAVLLSADARTIYYTTDGTDPRAIGGGIQGTSYSHGIRIAKPTHLKARARAADGEWSALADGTFWTPESPLAVTELMYHAPDGNPSDFVEVKNVSSKTITLKGYKFDNAIDFNFKNAAQASLAPGEFLVVVDDIDAFTSSYGVSNLAVAGEFSGDLSNGGEIVDLEFRNRDLVSFRYDDARNWPQAADGAGHSLVPLDAAMGDQELGSLDYGGNWRASTFIGGSPGEADPDLPATIVLNEVTAHTDTQLPPPNDSNDKIELYNTSPSPVTIQGWHLSDSLDDITKWLIPTTTIPGYGFVVFDETDFHVSETHGFGLDKAGEDVVLSAPGRVVDAVRFKGQENVDTGVSWGRYPDGVGDWRTTLPTEAAPNQLAAASVRISQLMFHPEQPGDDFEYIQIENLGPAPHTFETSAGTYRIDGGVDYDFPAGITLASGERLWILSFNPTNTLKLDLFCSAYGLDKSQETILGGYQGELSNRGERVAIERPQESDDPLDPLDVSWVVVDEVFYFDRSPWPQGADGTGYPLLRTDATEWAVPSAGDTDGDRLPDSWEILHFGNLDQGNTDWDNDQFLNLEEYVSGSDPKDPSSLLTLQSSKPPIIYWEAVTGRVYSVHWTPDLMQPFHEVATGLTQGSYTHLTHSVSSPNYYRITVELSP